MRTRSRNHAAANLRQAPARAQPEAGSAIALAVAAAIAGLTVPGAPLLAAEAEASASDGLEVIIVTARKRSENLQDVPVSIDVLSKKDLSHLAIEGFEDYAEKVPSISFISAGPGTQFLVVRGVADGSNPTYSNSSATGFFVDDMSTSWAGTQPDLHLYDIERIEVLNGPQGTTFGAGSMAGAVRYLTNKPDVDAFSAGVDFSGGAIKDGGENWTYEGFLNAPIIPGKLAVRISAFSDSHGGFIDNRLKTRTWVNGAVSDNAAWARKDYNREHAEGGRIALRAVLNDNWSGTLTYGFQRQNVLGAWDEDPNLPSRTVERFGPESNRFQAKMLDFHVDGDVGVADLVFASTYWSLPRRQQNEYSQYIENYQGGANEGVTCANDPVYGTGPYTDCAVPIQYYEYHTNPERWSNELRLISKPGGRFHWLAGLYSEKTRDKNSGSTFYMPGLRTDSPAFQYYNYYSGTAPGFTSLPPGVWYGYQTRTDYLQTTEFANISFDITDKFNVEAGAVHFKSDFSYYSPYGQFAYVDTSPGLNKGSSKKWNGKFGANYKFSNSLMLYANLAQGFRDGGTNSGYPQSCYDSGVPASYVPDTLNNYELGWKSTTLGGHLIWNGAAYLMKWKQLQTLIYDVDICAPSSFNVNVGDARIEGVESNVDYKLNDHWSVQASGSYTDSHLTSSPYAAFQANVGERLPFVPYFNWSWNLRYQLNLGAGLRGYAQLDMAHKGGMWNDLHVEGSHGFPRILQPGYSVTNLRFGLNPAGGRWLAELFVTNIADKNAIVYSNTFNFDLRQTTNEPRVVGLRLNYRFGKETNSE
ncbi:MAG: TonB-dependent receptor [Steroidobacteraceae bacterium]